MAMRRQVFFLSMDNVTLTLNGMYNGTTSDNQTMNVSSGAPEEVFQFNIIFMCGCILFIFGLVGNITTAFVIYCDRKLHNATYSVIAILALTDFLAICMRFTAFMMSLGLFSLYFTSTYANAFLIGNFVTLNSSNFIIVFLARLRYRLLVYPLHTANLKRKTVEMQCGLAWIASLVLGVFYGCNLILNKDEQTSYIVEFIWTFYLYLSTIIPIVTFHCLKVKNIRGTMTSSETITNKMATMVTVILSLQVVSLLPLCIGQVLIMVYVNIDMGSLVQCSMLLNHTINPVVFFMFAKLNTCIKRNERQKERLSLKYSCTTELI